MRIIFATYNPGKMDEVRALGQKFGIDVVSLADVGANIIFNESGATLEENARLKLSQALAAISDNTVDWVAADDTGIMIDALGGEPGVRVRRWIGREMTDQEIIDYTLERMKDVPNIERTARFICVAALGKNGRTPLTFEGDLDGSILRFPEASVPDKNGLPLGQLFFVSELGRVINAMHQNPVASGTVLSHRQKAFERVFRYLNDLQGITGQFE